MTYSEAIRFLYELRLFGTKLGLEKTVKLAALAGQPQDQLRFIHVAGTNGKGSTCAMLESIYRAAGLRTGLYTSPHLVSFRERMQVSGEWITEEEVIRLLEEMRPLLKEFPENDPPSFFEVTTVMALRHFANQKCDLVILETGMGGRLDATNIVTPLASVITNVQLDHQRWLGQTLTQIAAEKAGIIKLALPVITSEQKPEVLRVISETARRLEAPLTSISREDLKRRPLNSLKLPFLGEHQQMNAALAVTAVKVLAGQIPVPDDAVRAGLAQVRWPGRTQLVRTGIGRTILLDGAHNPSGAEALRSVLQKQFPNTLPTFILGFLRDKDWAGICRILAPLAGRICLAPVRSERSADAQLVREFCQPLNLYAEVLAYPSLDEALKQTAHDPMLVITGSLYFVGEAMEALKLVPGVPENERGLNDWGAKR